MDKELKQKLKKIKELRQAYHITYNKYVKDYNDFANSLSEINTELTVLSKQIDDILGFMERVIDISEDNKK
jgi:hypothetical protein